MTKGSPTDPREVRVQRYILERMKEALAGRSWNWLATRAEIPQSTLASQVGRTEDPEDCPRFSLTTVVLVADALRKPVAWFFPSSGDAELEAEAYRRIRELVDQTETSKAHD